MNDTEGIKTYAINNTNLTEQTIKEKTIDEIIDESSLLRCLFSRDELFTFFILEDGGDVRNL